MPASSTRKDSPLSPGRLAPATPSGGLRINQSRIVDGHTRLMEHDVMPDGSWKVFRGDPDKERRE